MARPATPPAEATPARRALTPSRYRLVGRRRETDDTFTLRLTPIDQPLAAARPGQFHMLTAFGIGEAAISVSGLASPAVDHTVRAVGAVTRALCGLPIGGVVGVRGPFGTHWATEELDGSDVVVIAGGIGLAPLREAVRALIAREGGGGGRLSVVVGARAPDQLLYEEDLWRWREAGAHVRATVDSAPPGWTGAVGLVTTLLDAVPFDPARAAALVCGPEVMIRVVAAALVDRGVAASAIRVSLERNMQCGGGLCGHCQLGPLLLCRDGPVVPYGGRVARLLQERER